MNKAVILLGGGGHAKVVADLLMLMQVSVLGVVNKNSMNDQSTFRNWPLLGEDDVVKQYSAQTTDLVNGIGVLPKQSLRAERFQYFVNQGYHFLSMIHPHAVVAQGVILAQGVQVMAGAIIQPDTVIGENTIVNTSASVDHDCQVGANCHIAPGAVLCGGVKVGDNVFVGTGVSIIQGIAVGEHAVIGAGAVVTRDVGAGDNIYSAR